MPLVGRERHLGVLATAFADMKRGQTVVVSVHGRSGAGKSALVQHFLEGLNERDEAVVLTGRCYERESVPYKALDSLVDSLSRHLKRLPQPEVQALLPRDIQLLARVFPVLRHADAVATASWRASAINDPQELRRRGFAALRELLARLGDRKPLVLLIDDLQWGDVDSAALLSGLLCPPDPPVLLMIECFRSDDGLTSPISRKLANSRERSELVVDRREIAVEVLTQAEAEILAMRQLGGADPATQAHAAVIARESGGNPFFVSELVRHVQLGAGLAAGSPSESALTLDEVLWARILRLPGDAKRLLEIVAISGRPLAQTDACQAAELGSEERVALAVLRSGRLIRVTGPIGRDEIDTYHDRIRETVMGHLPAQASKSYHLRLALEVEATGRGDPEFLALHFQGAGRMERAGEYFEKAAAHATETLAFDRAARLYRVALELRLTQRPAGHQLRLKLANALANAGRGVEAAREYSAAALQAHPSESLELRRRAALQFLTSGHFEEGLATLDGVLATVGMRLPSTPQRALWSMLMRNAQIRVRGLGFKQRESNQVSVEELTRIDVCWSCVVGFSFVDIIRAADFQARNLLLSLRTGEPTRIARALAMQAYHTSTGGTRSRERTQRILKAADDLTHQVAEPHVLGMVAMATGVADYFEGRWKKARESLERAETIFRDQCTGVSWELSTVRFLSIGTLFWTGEHAELSRRLPLYLAGARERGDLFSTVYLGSWNVQRYLDEDNIAKCNEVLDDFAADWSQSNFQVPHVQMLWASLMIDMYSGHGNIAWDKITRYWRSLDSSLILRVQLFRLAMWHLRARCALCAAAQSANPKPFLMAATRDARRMEREDTAVGWALARLIRAGVCASHGEHSKCLVLLADAERDLDALDMKHYASAAGRRIGELLGGDVGREKMAEADSRMLSQGVRNIRCTTRLNAPGFADL